MNWNCPECTYLNPTDQKICAMCEQGYRLFSDASDANEDDSAIATNEDEDSESVKTRTDSLVPDDVSEGDEDDSLLGSSSTKKDMYIRKDGHILYGQAAVDERKRSIAHRKALYIQKLWQLSSKQPSNSSFTRNCFQKSSENTSTALFASPSVDHFNTLNANLKGVHASATATTEVVSGSAVNCNATGANVSASAAATAVRANAFNANITGANASASATADALKVSVGNVNVTGVECAASSSASLAKVNIGNVNVAGTSVGASSSINATGVSAFNVSISGPSAAASANVDGAFSFGNIVLGARPSLDVGWGFNIGIPFLNGSGGSTGGGGGSGDSRNDENNSSEQPRGLEGYQQYLSQKFPNQRHYWRAADFKIEPNTSKEPIDPTLTDERVERTDRDDDQVNSVVDQHNKLIDEGWQFAGYKGGPKRDADGNKASSSGPEAPSAVSSSQNSEWAGMYTSPSPAVAGGYAVNDDGRPGQIDRVYLRKDAASSYYTKVGLNTHIGLQALRDVKEHSQERYIFSGPQHDTDPDLRAPETVISTSVRDEALNCGKIRFEPSAHQVDPRSYRVNPIYNKELASSQMIPDYTVRMTKGPDDCARDGGRERLAHVFDGRPPYVYETKPSKKSEPSEDDKLLIEECRKLGIEIPYGNLEDWKKKLRNDHEYEREEDDRMHQIRTSSTTAATLSEKSKTEKKEKESNNDEPPPPCKDHPPHIRCMNCLKRSSGAGVRNIRGQLHGFKFD
ncbi:unnamed protein product [Adineta ricciae]|uniref:RanBP2-type domain-containing protein n=1 Tax=Adineta ricciae TaxID=249248 RepID=A0A814AHR0_ADIRI|nr:unnamed protein product [Adineta ricciae]CAF0914382.1 unnamed protein product [Adineta ricciae]